MLTRDAGETRPLCDTHGNRLQLHQHGLVSPLGSGTQRIQVLNFALLSIEYVHEGRKIQNLDFRVL